MRRQNLHYFSRLIRDTRKTLNESGTEFGKRFGVSHASVSEWENGKAQAGWEVLFYCLNKMGIVNERPEAGEPKAPAGV